MSCNDLTFEKKIYFELIKNILTKKTINSNLSRGLDFIFEEIIPEKDFGKAQAETSLKKRKVYLNYIQKQIKKIEMVPKSRLQKKIEYLGEIFELNSSEIEVFASVVRYNTNAEFEKVINSVYANSLRFNLEIFSLKNVLNLSSLKIENAIFKLNKLGIIKCDNGISLSDKILKLFSNYGINKKSQIMNFLLGDEKKSNLKETDFLHLENEIKILKNILSAAIKTEQKGINILFWGDVGTGKTELVKTLANVCKTKLYEVSDMDDDEVEMSRRERISDFKRKQKILKSNACILFDEMEDLIELGTHNGSKSYINNMLDKNVVPTFWTTNDIKFLDKAFLRRMTFAIEFKDLSDDIRLNIWKRALKKNKLKIEDDKLIELNNSYNIPPSMIVNAIKTTKMTNGKTEDFEYYIKSIATLINDGENIKKNKDLTKNYNLELINTDLDIENLTNKIIQKGKLNFSMCLYGQSGTGKSAYARYLGEKLGLKTLLKKASDLISPFVGQTEINIAKAFKEAKENRAVLIIDEADNFLQNRKNAIHSWEISQVNEMLTAMETHEYPFICTTNLIDILDEASLRRFTFKIKFGFLKKNQIKEAFKHFFNLEAPTNILACPCLTSGDFATVIKKAEYMDITTPDEYADLLKSETQMKSKEIQSNNFGFNVL